MAEPGGTNGGGGGGGPPPPPPPPPPSAPAGSGPGGSTPQGGGGIERTAGLNAFYALIEEHSRIYKPVWSNKTISGISVGTNKILNASVARIAVLFSNTDVSNDMGVSTSFVNLNTRSIIIQAKQSMYFYFGIHGSLVMHDWFCYTFAAGPTSMGVMELLIQDVRH
jgi:hypothetical protein